MPNALKKPRRQSDGNSKSDQVRALLAKGMSAGDIAKKVGCSTNLVYVVKSTGGAKGKRAGTGPGVRQPSGDSKSGQVRALLATGMSAADIAKKVGCTTGLVYVIKSNMGKSGKRGPGRPRKVSASSGLDGLAGILDSVKNAERERVQLRAALQKIQTLLADALA